MPSVQMELEVGTADNEADSAAAFPSGLPVGWPSSVESPVGGGGIAVGGCRHIIWICRPVIPKINVHRTLISRQSPRPKPNPGREQPQGVRVPSA